MKDKSNISDQVAQTLSLLRILLGFIFLWAFLDKFFGLGFATCKDAVSGSVDLACNAAVVGGGSPTEGFLTFAASGPFADIYGSLAGAWIVDFLFMAGLLGIGTALMLGIGIQIAVYSGIALLLMMWTAVLPPENNPIVDEHIIYILVLVLIFKSNNQQVLGLGKWWRNTELVKKYSVLK